MMQWTLDFRANHKPVDSAAASLGQLQIQITKTGSAIDGLDRKGEGGFSSIASGAKAALGAVAALAAGFAGLGMAGDYAIKAFGERTSSLRAYTTLLGDAAKAETEFRKAGALAQMTDLTAGATRGAQKQLMIAGLRGEGLDRTLLAGMDLASTSENKDEALKSFARATGQIQQKGKLQAEELMQLAEGAGLGGGLVKDAIAKMMGLKDRNAAEKMISKGGVSSDVGLAAIQQAVLAQLGTKKLGEFATGSAGSMGSLISNRDEALTNLLQSFDSERLDGVKAYKASLTDLNNAMSLDTETGKNLSLVLQDGSSTLIGLKAVFSDFLTGFVDSFASSYVQALKDMGISTDDSAARMKESGASAKSLGETLGKIGTAAAGFSKALESIGVVFDALHTAWGWLEAGVDEIARLAVGIGMALSGNFSGAKEYLYSSQAEKYGTDGWTGADKNAWARTTMPTLAPGGGVMAGGGAWAAPTFGSGAEAATTPAGAPSPKAAAGKAMAAAARGAGTSTGAGGGSGGSGGGGGGDTIYDVKIHVEAKSATQATQELADDVVAAFARRIGRFSRTPGTVV